MGQYYKPVILNDKNKPVAAFKCYDFGSGAKLMEHSWIGNDFVGFVEMYLNMLPSKIVWAGDYADEDIYSEAYDSSLITHQQEVENKYGHDFGYGKKSKRLKYLINYDKKQFVDKSKVIDVEGWSINPLPLLTCEGNGRGGGDFRGRDQNNIVGSWARDLIGISSRKSDIPKGFKELNFNLIE
tara:strand:- start:433 stop:981 length:549 start_codon:yes stop_codon:yes gene_type:complete